MPNQRKKGKRAISLWLTEAEQEEVRRTAAALGISVSDLMKLAAHEIAKRRGTANDKRDDNRSK